MPATVHARHQFVLVFLALIPLSSCSEPEQRHSSVPAAAALCEQGYRACLHDDFPKAVSNYRSAISQLKDLHDTLGTAVVSKDLAEVFLAKGQFDEAVASYKDSVNAFKTQLSLQEDNGITVCLIESLRGLAAACIKGKHLVEGRASLTQALELARRAGFKDLVSQLENDYAMASISNQSQSKELAELKLFNSAFDEQEIPIFKQMRKAWLARSSGDLSSAIAELKQAERLCSQTATLKSRQINDLHRATCKAELGLLFRQSGKNDEAVEELETCYAIRKSILWPEHPEVLSSLEPLIMALCAEQSWDRASELLLGSTSLPAGEVWRGIRETILTNEIVLADKEDACKNYAKAKNHADLALHLALLKPTQAKQLIDALEKSGTMNFRLGVVMKSAVAEKRSRGSKIKQSELKKEKFFSDAEDCYKKADAILAELDDDFPDKKARQASLVMEIASTALVGKDDLAKAEEQFKEAVNLSKSIGNDKQAQFCLDRIADIAKMRAALPASNRGKNAN